MQKRARKQNENHQKHDFPARVFNQRMYPSSTPTIHTLPLPQHAVHVCRKASAL